jgi:hypothetical protein
MMRHLFRALVGTGVGAAGVLVASSAMAFPDFFDHHGPDHGGQGSGPTAVPEINGHGAATGLAIVLGGAAVVLSSRKRRQ